MVVVSSIKRNPHCIGSVTLRSIIPKKKSILRIGSSSYKISKILHTPKTDTPTQTWSGFF